MCARVRLHMCTKNVEQGMGDIRIDSREKYGPLLRVPGQ